MNHKESVNLYRVLSVIGMVLATLVITVVLCGKGHFYLDEGISLLCFDVIYLFICFFELEHERCRGRISSNVQTNLVRLAVVYIVCCMLIYGMTFFPEFYRPVMVVPVFICAASSMTLAVSTGIFFDVLLALAAGGSFYELACYGMMTVIAAVLADALKIKKYGKVPAILMAVLNFSMPGLFYYMSYKEVSDRMILFGIINSILTAVSACIFFPRIWHSAKNEIEDQLLDIVSEDYSEVKALRDFSMGEYHRAKKMGDIAYRCAKQVGFRPNLCLAGGFYYRMGLWLGEPYVKRAVDKASAQCFPAPLVDIISEYQAQENLPSSPESALIHMVDALMIKIEALEQKMGGSQWNMDMLIYQTLNEYSANGIYDQSGMSMNQFLKVREFLAKEEMLH